MLFESDESGEKSNKLFLNLEKTRSSQVLIRTLFKNEKEFNDPAEINTEPQDFDKTLFTDNLSISKEKGSFSSRRFAYTKTPGSTGYKM